MNQITVLIVEDQILFEEALQTAFIKEKAITIGGHCRTGADALRMFETVRPDVVLMDINMKPVNGFEASQQILERYPDARIIWLSIHANRSYAEKMMQIGARGYLPKTASYKKIIEAIKMVATGETYVSDELQTEDE